EDGRIVKIKRLLRAGELVGICSEDKQDLKDNYDLKLIVDFRSIGEVAKYPDDEIEGVGYINNYLHKPQPENAPPPSQKEFRKLREIAKVVEYMTNVYDRLLRNPFTIDALSRFIDIVKDNREGAILFHCYAGKDRTGVAAAILYSLLGVTRADILAEYMLTNHLRKKENERLLQKAKEKDDDPQYLEALKVTYEVLPQYLEHYLDNAEAISGSVISYIQTHMNVTDDDIVSLRDNYLE
ncbi:MAG: tyrosine-protein phosphatase, partial [Oscillospiraceae bacterium]|nr:tyrosine-protein phosphatase [Oscillospiraceae bacterium]